MRVCCLCGMARQEDASQRGETLSAARRLRNGVPKCTWCWPTGVGPEEAGISRGSADLYNAGIDGQWVDITGIPNGTLMILEDEVNPEHLVQEMDVANNRAFVPIVVVKR